MAKLEKGDHTVETNIPTEITQLQHHGTSSWKPTPPPSPQPPATKSRPTPRTTRPTTRSRPPPRPATSRPPRPKPRSRKESGGPTMTDTPKIDLVLTDLEKEIATPEPYIVVLPKTAASPSKTPSASASPNARKSSTCTTQPNADKQTTWNSSNESSPKRTTRDT